MIREQNSRYTAYNGLSSLVVNPEGASRPDLIALLEFGVLIQADQSVELLEQRCVASNSVAENALSRLHWFQVVYLLTLTYMIGVLAAKY
jgi:hypothetical protein